MQEVDLLVMCVRYMYQYILISLNVTQLRPYIQYFAFVEEPLKGTQHPRCYSYACYNLPFGTYKLLIIMIGNRWLCGRELEGWWRGGDDWIRVKWWGL